MNKQKGISSGHFIISLVLLGIVAVVYVFYQKYSETKLNEASYNTLSILRIKLNDKMTVAQSTPRISLGAVLNDISNLKSEIDTAKVSKCLEPAKTSLSSYANVNLKMMTDFAADRVDPTTYLEESKKRADTETQFTKDLEKCKPE